MNQLTPRISIVVPVLNSVTTIEKAIRSVLDQGYTNTELIILDAGSTDGTVDVIKRYESQIAYWHSKPDGSPGLALNVGLTKATGELTGQLMADDWYEPGTFALAAKAYFDNPGVEIISFAGRIVSSQGVVIARSNPAINSDEAIQCPEEDFPEYVELQRYDTAAQLEITLHNMCYSIPALDARFITKKYLEKIGLLEPLDADGKHNFSTDRELLIRAAVLGCNNIFVSHLGHTYFAHQASATFGKNRANQKKILQEHMDLVKNYFKKYDLTRKQKSLLKSWFADQSVRLFMFSILDGDFSKAYRVVKTDVRWVTIKWFSALFTVPAGCIKKKLLACCSA